LDRLRQATVDRVRAELAVSIAGAAVGATREDVIGNSRAYRAVLARQVAMYLVHIGGGISLGRAAAAFGRDRSTVAYAVRALELRRDQPEFDAWLQALEDSYAHAPVMT
jgi:chromosomal replication initiation ATPase DnaA